MKTICRNIIAAILAMTVILSIFPVGFVFAEQSDDIVDSWLPGTGDSQKDFTITYGENGENSVLNQYLQNQENVMIPFVVGQVDGQNVTQVSIVTIKENAFKNRTNVKRVTIPPSVTKIEANAFTGSGLTAIWIPDSVTEIAENAFPTGTKIYCYENSFAEEYATSKNFDLQLIHRHLQIVNGALFDFDANYEYTDTTLILPEIIFEFGFNNTPNYTIKELTLHENICTGRRTELKLLGNFHRLETIAVASENTFMQAIDGNLYSKGGKALLFYPEGKKDTSFTIPEGVEKVDGYFFTNCWTLEEINIPSTLVSIREGALSGINLKRVNVHENNPNFYSDDGVVYGLVNRNPNQYMLITYPSWKEGQSTYTVLNEIKGKPVVALSGKAFFRQQFLKTIIIPEGITSMGSQPFIYCSMLQEINIPKSLVDGLDMGNFCNGSLNLKTINVPEDHPILKSVDGVIYSKDGKKLIIYPNGRLSENNRYEVISGTESIGQIAFCETRTLNEIILPEGLILIENGAFSNCTSLQRIVLPTTLKSIEPTAFSDCTSLQEVVFPENAIIENIGRAAFRRCLKLNLIRVPDSVKTVSIGVSEANLKPFPEHTYVVAGANSIMRTNDPIDNKPYGGSHLLLPTDFILGDLNGDGKISMQDLQVLKDYLKGAIAGIVKENADVDGNGVVDLKDLERLIKMLL